MSEKTIGVGRFDLTAKGKYQFIVTDTKTGETWERVSLAGAHRLIRQLERERD